MFFIVKNNPNLSVLSQEKQVRKNNNVILRSAQCVTSSKNPTCAKRYIFNWKWHCAPKEKILGRTNAPHRAKDDSIVLPRGLSSSRDADIRQHDVFFPHDVHTVILMHIRILYRTGTDSFRHEMLTSVSMTSSVQHDEFGSA